ncbi:MAG: glycosyltransferase family 2 protein [Woeseiaceae bacterium]|jgi:rhamnosyltransferase|nr:glycosyltransferase family 2 protein [Woeseiaceae bacterium]
MKYDVVIRCKNEMEWLPRVITSLKNQTIKPTKIIIVDNASNDGSQEYALEQDCLLVNYNQPQNADYNYSRALNIGIHETSENEVLILSAHCELVTSRSVQNLIETRYAFDAGGVYGRQIPTLNSNPVDTRDLLTVFGRERIVFTTHPFFHNAFSLIDRSAWELCHFDESINGIEDRLWAREQALKGRKIIYDPESIVYHEHGLNQNLSMNRALRVCKQLKYIHKDDIFDWPTFDQEDQSQ